MKPQLLVSVRSAAEAVAAMAGGADVIDVKEPSRGSLGRSDPETIAAVVEAVGGRVPVSAAMGEWRESAAAVVPSGLTFVKWGLSGCGNETADALRAIDRTAGPATPVAVAYADHERAEMPPPEAVARIAADQGFRTLLIDTFCKDGHGLLDWMAPAALARLMHQLRNQEMGIALAGSLDLAAIASLLPIRPNWIAVRGAACEGGREGVVSEARVRTLANVVKIGRKPFRLMEL